MDLDERLRFVFNPQEGVDPFELGDMVFMPEAACLACEKTIQEDTWNELLGKIQDQNADNQIKRVLEASPRERLVAFATSGLGHYVVDGKPLEKTIYGFIERALGRQGNHEFEEAFDAAFLMMRIYLQGRNVMLVEGENREWMAKMLEVAFQRVKPFSFKDFLPEIQTLCSALRSNGDMSVLLVIGELSWKPHWSQLLEEKEVLTWLEENFGEKAPLFCQEIARLTPRALPHLGAKFFNDLIEQEKDQTFKFDLFANMVLMMESAFNLSPLKTTHVFEEIEFEPVIHTSSDYDQGSSP